MSELLASCRNVSVVYGSGESEVRALDGVALEIAPGDSMALLGRSGSGKTTLLHVLGGLVEPTSGAVEWRGRPLSSLDAAARGAIRAHGIAYVFQGANLLPHFTAFENLAFAARVSSGEADPALAPLAPLDAAARAGLRARGIASIFQGSNLLPHFSAFENVAFAARVSGGEAQRVAIARALAQEPELLLCDEPTGHLDSDTGDRVLDLIEALQAELGFALVVATHDPDVAARLRRPIVLHDGRVVAESVT